MHPAVPTRGYEQHWFKVERERVTLSEDERQARDQQFLASDGMTAKEGRLWDRAWKSARKYYLNQP